jgi:GNAT superfamily N-acetyltransferase
MLFVDQEVAQRIELCHNWRSAQHARAYQALHPEAGVQIEQVGSGFAIFEKPDSPINRCGGLGFDGPVSLADIEAVEAFYKSHHEAARISLCPLADPSLLEILKARRYCLDKYYTVLVRALPEPCAPVEVPPGILIRRTSPELAGVWLDTVARGFSAPDEPDQALYDILSPNFYAANAVTFLAYSGNEPAGGGGMYLHANTVEFGSASTLLAYRRRGIQTALLQVRMQTARQEGCDLGIVLASPGSHSQRSIQRLGFEVVYSLAVMVSP